VGLGAIGLAVAQRARAFGIQVYVVDKPDRKTEMHEQISKLELQTMPDLPTLLAYCDIVSLNVPATPETRGLVDSTFLAAVQPGTIILNTSRGDMIDEAALLKAMDEKDVRVGLDVYADEPAASQSSFDSQLATHPNVYGTHHIGASTDQAQAAVADGVLEIIKAFDTGQVLHCVNGQA
jgi:D-3-phosphoglycerate dehydrogenase